MPVKLVTQDLLPEAAEFIIDFAGLPKTQEALVPPLVQPVGAVPTKYSTYGKLEMVVPQVCARAPPKIPRNKRESGRSFFIEFVRSDDEVISIRKKLKAHL